MASGRVVYRLSSPKEVLGVQSTETRSIQGLDISIMWFSDRHLLFWHWGPWPMVLGLSASRSYSQALEFQRLSRQPLILVDLELGKSLQFSRHHRTRDTAARSEADAR